MPAPSSTDPVCNTIDPEETKNVPAGNRVGLPLLKH
jgi:hypothetical protein